MSSHLIFPYEWKNCLNRDTCEHLAHLDISPEELNASPVEWVEALLGGNCEIGVNYFAWLHETSRVFHRENGPAVESADGMVDMWFVKGARTYEMEGTMLKRPFKGLTREWFVDGKHHRVDGPAVVCEDGGYMWWMNGERQRAPDGGPAGKYSNGSYKWEYKGAPWYDGRLFKWWWLFKQKHSLSKNSW